MNGIQDDGDLRMLGACDGYAHAMMRVKLAIGHIDGRYSPAIHPRHTRKRAQRDAVLKPLREMEKWLRERHDETHLAYDKTRATRD